MVPAQAWLRRTDPAPPPPKAAKKKTKKRAPAVAAPPPASPPPAPAPARAPLRKPAVEPGLFSKEAAAAAVRGLRGPGRRGVVDETWRTACADFAAKVDAAADASTAFLADFTAQLEADAEDHVGAGAVGEDDLLW